MSRRERTGVWLRPSPATVALAALIALHAAGATAGDASARRFIGFSPDGSTFAFEQYGTLDDSESHSGWSEIAIIDTHTDTFVGGKPITTIDEKRDSGLSLKQARARTAALAAPILARFNIALRGTRTASDKFTFPDDTVEYDDISRVETASPKSLKPIFDALEIGNIRIEEIVAASTGDCTSSFDPAQAGDKAGKALGFRLSLDGQDGKTFKVLHEDATVPASRNCPTSYSLSEAYVFTPKAKPPVIAVLVQQFSQGYEGRDRRFIAVAGRVR